ncbi:MAG TPA: hypothetical protein DGG95_07130 [Cytophagales bacterium]|jgi:hypothetical protein|nr:hypothetical protein [Cytophagales bacterium]
MKIPVYFYILLLSTDLLGQTKEEMVTVNKEMCESGKERALKRLALGQICFPRYIFESSITLRKTLEIDYGILDELYDTLYDIGYQSEFECHDEIMKKAIEDKWGEKFLKDQKEIADKLDKQNLGFKEPTNEKIETSIKKYLNENLKIRSTVYNYFELGVIFTISPRGQVVKLKVSKAREFLTKDDPTYLAVEKACEGFKDNWTPATINKVPKQADKYFFITIEMNK